jgi:hypothetical protein
MYNSNGSTEKPRKVKLLLSTLLVLLPMLLYSSTPTLAEEACAGMATLKGRVRDPSDGSRYSGVRLQVTSTCTAAVTEILTDAEGKFTLAGIPAGGLVTVVAHQGDEIIAKGEVTPEPNETTVVDFLFP